MSKIKTKINGKEIEFDSIEQLQVFELLAKSPKTRKILEELEKKKEKKDSESV